MQSVPYSATPPFAVASPTPVQGIGKAAAALLGLRALTPVLGWVTFRVLSVVSPMPKEVDRADHPALALRRTISDGLDGLDGLLGLVALICFFVWLARVYGFIRATRGETRYSTGLAIGSWFIPIANLFLPYLAVRDAFRRGADDRGGGLVLSWWLAWLPCGALTFADAVFRQIERTPSLWESMKIPVETLVTLDFWLYYASAAAQIIAYGLFAAVVTSLNRSLRARGAL